MTVSRAAAVAVVVLALLCCTDITSAVATATPTRSATSISIEPGTLPEAKTIALSRQRDGEWQFDFTAASEDAFFAAENRDTKLWREWRNHVRSLRAYRQQQQLVNEEQAGTADKKADGRPEGSAAALTDYFSERQVQRRIQSAVKQQASFDTDTTEGMRDAWTKARDNVAALWQQLKAAGTTAAPAEKAYRELAERHFAHTSARAVRDIVPSLGANTTAAAATTASSAPFALLRTPIVLDAEVLPQVEKELRSVRGIWQNRSNTIADRDADVVRAEVEAELRALDDVVAASRLLVARVVALADPLAQAAASWVSASFESTHAAIVGNDGATEAKEMQLKQLLKHRARLVKAKEVLDQYSSVYKGVLHRKQLPAADALLFALELVARQRLGDDVGNAVEVLPLLSATAPLTALVEKEWVSHVLYPFGLCCLITAAFLWLAGEVKEWCLRRVQASRMRLGGVSGRSPGSAASNTSGRLRKLFLFACLLESVVPPLLPAVVLAVHFSNAGAWASGVLLLMRPSQRVVCLAVLLGLMAASYVWGVVVRRLFQIIDPSVYRRRHAKTK